MRKKKCVILINDVDLNNIYCWDFFHLFFSRSSLFPAQRLRPLILNR